MMKRMGVKIAKITLRIIIFAALLWLSATLGEQIFLGRFFKSLPNYEITDIEDKKVCPIHVQAPANAPIMVNLNEGYARPIDLYQTYVTYSLQIREVENYGYMHLIAGRGWSGAAFPDNNYADINIRREDMTQYSEEAASHSFCEECMTLIKEINPTCNFIIVDGYDLSKLTFYNLEDIESEEGIKIRHYYFTLEEKDYDRYSIKMHSTFYEGGKTLDYLNKEDTSELEKYYDFENRVNQPSDNTNNNQ